MFLNTVTADQFYSKTGDCNVLSIENWNNFNLELESDLPSIYWSNIKTTRGLQIALVKLKQNFIMHNSK